MTEETAKYWATGIHLSHPSEEFMVVDQVDSQGRIIRIKGDRGQVLFQCMGVAEDAKRLVDELKSLRVAARLKSTKLVECPLCSCYHPVDWEGDCREDGTRFPPPDDSADEAEFFAVNDDRRPNPTNCTAQINALSERDAKLCLIQVADALRNFGINPLFGAADKGDG